MPGLWAGPGVGAQGPCPFGETPGPQEKGTQEDGVQGPEPEPCVGCRVFAGRGEGSRGRGVTHWGTREGN